MNKRFRPSSTLLSTLIILGTLVLPVLAAPLQNPPSGNVDANFASVTAGGLNIDTTGALSNPTIQNAGRVQVFDPNGFAFSTDSTASSSFVISGVGNIFNSGSLHNGNVQIADSQGFSIADDGAVPGLFLSDDGSITNMGAKNSGGVIVNDALTVNGHLKATGGMGKIVKRAGSPSSTLTSGMLGSSLVNCAAGETLMSCSYTNTSSDINVYQISLNGDTSTAPTTCGVAGKNTGSISGTITSYAVCWNPNL